MRYSCGAGEYLNIVTAVIFADSFFIIRHINFFPFFFYDYYCFMIFFPIRNPAANTIRIGFMNIYSSYSDDRIPTYGSSSLLYNFFPTGTYGKLLNARGFFFSSFLTIPQRHKRRCTRLIN